MKRNIMLVTGVLSIIFGALVLIGSALTIVGVFGALHFANNAMLAFVYSALGSLIIGSIVCIALGSTLLARREYNQILVALVIVSSLMLVHLVVLFVLNRNIGVLGIFELVLAAAVVTFAIGSLCIKESVETTRIVRQAY